MAGSSSMNIQETLEKFASFPVASFDTIAPGTSLVLAPHPDDESLGCGGFIATAVAQGRPPIVVIVSDGSASHPGSRVWPPDRLARQRQEESIHAASLLGLSSDRLIFMGLQDTKIPTEGAGFNSTVDDLCSLLSHHGCENLLVAWRYDPHCDHEAVWFMGLALKALNPELRVLAYPVWGLTLPPEMDIPEDVPTGWRLNVQPCLRQKRQAIEAHRSQRGLVVKDDPDGFVLPDHLLEKMLQPYEIFIAS
ncbi:LmbE family protein [Gluconobacter thailandicus]|nr:LmbE family protein [Gluconobacter thailandicus]